MKTLTELLEIANGKGLAFETLADQANFINGFRTAEKIYTKGDEMKNQVEEVLQWFRMAVPEPTDDSRSVQYGCHLEEVSECLTAIGDYDEANVVSALANTYKGKSAPFVEQLRVINGQEKLDLLDSLCDQIVTAIGVAHMFGFDIVGALAEVNRSNFSKFVDGKPVFNAQGKIAKPVSYSPPVLNAFLGGAK